MRFFTAFLEKAYDLAKDKGYFSFITPVSWQSGGNFSGFRKFVRENGLLRTGLILPYNIFSDAFVDTGIYLFKKDDQTDSREMLVFEFPIRAEIQKKLDEEISYRTLQYDSWIDKLVLNPNFYSIHGKIVDGAEMTLDEISESIRGILQNNGNEEENQDSPKKNLFVGGIYRYTIQAEFKKIPYDDTLKEKPGDYSFFQGERILIRRIISRKFQLMATVVEDEFVNKKDIYILKIAKEGFNASYILSILNSKLISFILTKGSVIATKDDFSQLTLEDIRKIPIKRINQNTQMILSNEVERILELNRQFHQELKISLDFLQAEFNLDRVTKNLNEFYRLSPATFLKELKKSGATKKSAQKSLSMHEKEQIMQWFNDKKDELNRLKDEINGIDKKIDKIVYEIYGLNSEEVNLIEDYFE